MAKYCGRCGSKLDEQTGRCPVCDKVNGAAGKRINPEMGWRPEKPRKAQKRKRKRRIWIVILVVIFVLAGMALAGFLMHQGQLAIPMEAEDEGPVVERDVPETDTSGFTYYPSSEENIAPVEDSGLFFVNNEILVMLESEEQRPQLENALAEIGGEIVGELPLVAQYQVLLDEPRTSNDMEALCAELEKTEGVESASLNYAFELDEEYYPNDKKWQDKWGDIPAGINWGVEAIDAPEAWEHRDDMEIVNIGVFDCMFNVSHEDLEFAEDPFGNILALNAVKKGDLEWSSHGNHVAGTIAAGFDNQVGISGIAVRSNLYGVSYKGLCRTGCSSIQWMNAGLYYLIAEKDCSAINMSFGHDSMAFNASRECNAAINDLNLINTSISNLLERLIDQGKQFVVCVAAGNQNEENNSSFWGNNKYQYFLKDPDDTNYPYDYIRYSDYLNYLESGEEDDNSIYERYRNQKSTIKKRLISGNVDAVNEIVAGIENQKVAERIIVVGAVENTGSHKEGGFLWFGGTEVHDGYAVTSYSQCGSRVDVVAPGEDIYSTVKTGYGKKGGTSMAAPHVSGVAAMIFSLDPDIKGERVKEIIKESATGSYGTEGYGLLNANNAVERVLEDQNVTETEASAQSPSVDNSNIPDEAQEFNGHYYLICSPNQVTTWEEAAAYCQDLGGYLATITSQEENTFLTSLITGVGRRSAYIGLSDKEEGTWTWVTGEDISYHNWRENEPNNDDGDEYYVMVYDDGSWNDANFIYEEGRPSERNVQCYIKARDSSLNLREEPKHESDLAHEVTSETTLMKFYGQIQQGLGSDGQMHDWYKVYIGSYVSGWARSDLIKKVDQKSIQGNDGVAFVCEWGPYAAEGSTGNNPSTPSGFGSGASSPVRDVVLVLDVSGSMDGNPMEETKTAAVRFIETVLQENNARIGIVTYDSQAERIADFSTNEAQLEQAVQSINSGSSTDIESGLREAQSMLASSQANKKILVLMSDGEPNEGKEGDELVAYADAIKAKGVRIYTLGFFTSLSDKSAAQSLMERIATDGCHYEVASAEDLVFFFGDMADQINGQKYIYVRIACPVDVSVTYNGERLSSAESDLNMRTGFGTLTFEENEEAAQENQDDRVKILRLKEGVDYDLELVGTGRGLMDYTIAFMDEEGEYSDFRTFENVRITDTTAIDTVAGVSATSELNIDEDGDGKYDRKLRAEANGHGEEVAVAAWVYVAAAAVVMLVLIDICMLVILKKRKKRKGR